MTNSRYDLVIVCALHEKELDSVLDTGVTPWQPLQIDNDPTSYYHTTYSRADGAPLSVIAAAAPQMGMTDSAVLATKMILRFAPQLVAMVGIAAGADEAKQGFGDILAPNTTFDYGSGKLVSDGDDLKLKPDPKPLAIEAPLFARLQAWKRQRRHVDAIRQAWRGEKPRTPLEIHVGPLGSGSAVLDARKPLTDVVEHWRKLIGIEMEAHGVHLACQNACTPKPWFLCIKSICDFAANKSDAWQHYAAFTAAQFFHQFVTEEWHNFSFPTRAAVAAPRKQQDSEMASVLQEITHLKEQLAVQTEQLALQRGSIREIIASITATIASPGVPVGGARVGTSGPSELVALEGIWERAETGSTACMRVVNGELRCPYLYRPGSISTGEYHSIRAINGALFGRFRWFDGSYSGYFYLRIESPDRLVGGWWYAEDVPADAIERLPHVEGMVESTWIRQPLATSFPPWAERFFEDLSRAAKK
jgi:nucleoside phosphorylase